MMKAEMRRGRMTMKQYLKAKGLSEGAKNKTVIVPVRNRDSRTRGKIKQVSNGYPVAFP